MSNISGPSYRRIVTLVGLMIVGIIGPTATQVVAQFSMPGIGGEGARGGRESTPRREDREQPRRIERGGRERGGGIGIGIDIIGGPGQEGARQPGRQPESRDRTQRAKEGRDDGKQTKRTPRSHSKGDPPRPPAPPPTTMFFNPLQVDCHDCDELLKLIYKRQTQIAEDEEKLRTTLATKASLQDQLKLDQASLAKVIEKKDKDYYAERINATNAKIKFEDSQVDILKANIAMEQKSLADLIGQFKKCVERHCPGTMAKKHSNIIQVTDNGRQEGLENIDCHGHKGRISVRTGVNMEWDSTKKKDPNDPDKPLHEKRENEISISYSGTNCDDCAWVQFNWTEVLLFTKNGDKIWKKGIDPATGGRKEFTQDPKNPKYIVDSQSPTNASYEGGGGTYNADGQSDTIFDKPTPGLFDRPDDDPFNPAALEDEKGDTNITRIEWIDHYDTFLICNGEVCAKVTWDSTYEWKRDGDNYKFTGPKYSNIGTSKTGKPNAAQYQALMNKYSPK